MAESNLLSPIAIHPLKLPLGCCILANNDMLSEGIQFGSESVCLLGKSSCYSFKASSHKNERTCSVFNASLLFLFQLLLCLYMWAEFNYFSLVVMVSGIYKYSDIVEPSFVSWAENIGLGIDLQSHRICNMDWRCITMINDLKVRKKCYNNNYIVSISLYVKFTFNNKINWAQNIKWIMHNNSLNNANACIYCTINTLRSVCLSVRNGKMCSLCWSG